MQRAQVVMAGIWRGAELSDLRVYMVGTTEPSFGTSDLGFVGAGAGADIPWDGPIGVDLK